MVPVEEEVIEQEASDEPEYGIFRDLENGVFVEVEVKEVRNSFDRHFAEEGDDAHDDVGLGVTPVVQSEAFAGTDNGLSNHKSYKKNP